MPHSDSSEETVITQPIKVQATAPRLLLSVHKSQHLDATWVRAILSRVFHGSTDFIQFVTLPPPLPQTPKRVRLVHAVRIILLNCHHD